MIIWMAFLHECVVTFPKYPPRLVVDDDGGRSGAPSSCLFCANKTAMRLKFASVSFLKNPSVATELKLSVGRSTIRFSNSSVTLFGW